MLVHFKIYTDSPAWVSLLVGPAAIYPRSPSNNITIITQMTIPSTCQPQMLLKSPNLYLEMHFHSAASYMPWATIQPGNNSITIQSIAYKGIASASKHTDSPDWNVPSVCITSTAFVPIVTSPRMGRHTHSDSHTYRKLALAKCTIRDELNLSMQFWLFAYWDTAFKVKLQLCTIDVMFLHILLLVSHGRE